jgi:hypothetical protein
MPFFIEGLSRTGAVKAEADFSNGTVIALSSSVETF